MKKLLVLFLSFLALGGVCSAARAPVLVPLAEGADPYAIQAIYECQATCSWKVKLKD